MIDIFPNGLLILFGVMLLAFLAGWHLHAYSYPALDILFTPDDDIDDNIDEDDAETD